MRQHLTQLLPIRLVAVRAMAALVPILENDLEPMELANTPEHGSAIDIEFLGETVDTRIASSVDSIEVVDDRRGDAALRHGQVIGKGQSLEGQQLLKRRYEHGAARVLQSAESGRTVFASIHARRSDSR
jgi:hypothetical protein